MQGRQLVAKGLATARRHQHKGVAATDDLLNDFLLVRPEILEAEDPLEGF